MHWGENLFTSGGRKPGVPALAACRWGSALQAAHTWIKHISAFDRKSRPTLRWPGQLQEGGAVLEGREEQEPLEGRVEEWCEVREARSNGVRPKLSVA